MNVFLAYALALVVLIVFFKMIRIVPEQESYIVEQFGKYKKTLGSGMHLLIPVVHRIAYKHILKEEVIDVEPQICITNDNVQVTVDGILYLKVVDPAKASYGIDNYRYATAQLAKTTMRSEIGKLVLDRTFSERDTLNNAIVKEVDQASDPWGIKVTRYEIKDISPTDTIEAAMEQQMRAEREKRAEILASEGVKESRINVSKGQRQEAINLSKGERQRVINESEGRARAIETVAAATAQGIKAIADAIRKPHGKTAMNLQIAEQFITQFGKIIDSAEASILPSEIANLKGIVQSLIPALAASETVKEPPRKAVPGRPERREGGGA